jgi:hypothetical protein
LCVRATSEPVFSEVGQSVAALARPARAENSSSRIACRKVLRRWAWGGGRHELSMQAPADMNAFENFPGHLLSAGQDINREQKIRHVWRKVRRSQISLSSVAPVLTRGANHRSPEWLSLKGVWFYGQDIVGYATRHGFSTRCSFTQRWRSA